MMMEDWTNGFTQAEDIDPTREIFLLICMVFFLISAVQLLSQTDAHERNVHVNTLQHQEKKSVDAAYIADLSVEAGRLLITQDGTPYTMPDQLARLLAEGRFESKPDGEGGKARYLIVRDPEERVMAGDLLSFVQLLNDAGIGVDFRTTQGAK